MPAVSANTAAATATRAARRPGGRAGTTRAGADASTSREGPREANRGGFRGGQRIAGGQRATARSNAAVVATTARGGPREATARVSTATAVATPPDNGKLLRPSTSRNSATIIRKAIEDQSYRIDDLRGQVDEALLNNDRDGYYDGGREGFAAGISFGLGFYGAGRYDDGLYSEGLYGGGGGRLGGFGIGAQGGTAVRRTPLLEWQSGRSLASPLPVTTWCQICTVVS